MNSGYSEKIFSRVYQRDFESLEVVVIINFWLLQMASRRRTCTAAEAARYILEADGSELDRTDSDIEIVVNRGMFTNWVQLVCRGKFR